MSPRTLLLTALAMLAFAGNSLLCRLALRETAIDAASFTAVRLLAGACTLWLLLQLRQNRQAPAGSWAGAVALFTYAAAFSFAYLQLDTGAGALLLFGAVQLSMLLWGLLRGERLGLCASLGTALATAGLLALLLPGASAPPLQAALLMLLAGVAWGAYSLLGRGQGNPLAVTAGNFLRATPLALLLALAVLPQLNWDGPGLFYALLSGALTSGVGYAIWYSALPGLHASQAATVQLSVPILAALGGSLLLSEALTLRLLLSAVAVLGGIALVLSARQRAGS
ncbi:EamA family transporter [Pseudomonas sp. REST10]|uniref:EamA family transporter n=1 Tax=Pseudomonas sp. REST10 TaxID=2512235 RepID=UPI00240E40F9|nr:EamA family transporter [Pseudomonas sp. REST10]WFC61392.1 EamA family transporter [Pseudomonas sp. REST10]|tara:strand:+ start:2128 stop:2973 length:846 start_codon:yes stop_codon:yes gene_type:complete